MAGPRSDSQRRAMFARMRRGTGRVYRYYKTLAKDPEVRKFAGHLAALGLITLVVLKTPNPRGLALRKLRSMTRPGTPNRKALIEWVSSIKSEERALRAHAPALRAFGARERRKAAGLAAAKALGKVRWW